MFKYLAVFALALFLVMSQTNYVHAYIGPGAGLGAIAVFVAVIVIGFLLVLGFVWYPLKRILKSKKSKN